MRNLMTALFAAFFLFETKGQQPVPAHLFEIKPVREAALLATGSYLLIHGKILEKKLDGLTAAQLDALMANPPQKLGFAERHYSRTAREWSNVMTAPAFGTAAALCFSEAKNRHDIFRNGLVLTETALLSLGAATITKNTVKRLRPFIYSGAAPVSRKLGVDARQSFFSGHTCTTAAASFFSAKIWTENHRSSPLVPVVWTAAAAYPMAVGYLRMRGGMHYFRDVATGYLVGAAIGFCVPAIHRRINI